MRSEVELRSANQPSPDGSITLEGIQIVYRNFEGRAGMYNKEGERNFSIVLNDEQAELLYQGGWNVKTKPPREEGDRTLHTLSVEVKYGGRTVPRIVLITTKGRTPLDEELSGLVDACDILFVDITIRPYDWARNGKSGRKAYLKTIMVVLDEDALEQKYEHLPLLDRNGRVLAPGYHGQTPELESGYASPQYDYEGEVISDEEIENGEKYAIEQHHRSGENGQ